MVNTGGMLLNITLKYFCEMCLKTQLNMVYWNIRNSLLWLRVKIKYVHDVVHLTPPASTYAVRTLQKEQNTQCLAAWVQKAQRTVQRRFITYFSELECPQKVYVYGLVYNRIFGVCMLSIFRFLSWSSISHPRYIEITSDIYISLALCYLRTDPGSQNIVKRLSAVLRFILTQFSSSIKFHSNDS